MITLLPLGGTDLAGYERRAWLVGRRFEFGMEAREPSLVASLAESAGRAFAGYPARQTHDSTIGVTPV